MPFDTALGFVLSVEGAYVNRADDKGGSTNKGVTQRTYDAWRSRKDLTPRDVRLIDDDEVREIYLRQYWNAAACDRYEPGLALAVFDAGVNSGVSQSVRWLQRATWVTPEDGMPGVDTVKAAVAGDWRQVAWAHLCLRRTWLRGLAGETANQGGWQNRLNKLRDAIFIEQAA
jgi:lysozyme family protein